MNRIRRTIILYEMGKHNKKRNFENDRFQDLRRHSLDSKIRTDILKFYDSYVRTSGIQFSWQRLEVSLGKVQHCFLPLDAMSQT